MYCSGWDWWITRLQSGHVFFSSRCCTRQLLQTKNVGAISFPRLAIVTFFRDKESLECSRRNENITFTYMCVDIPQLWWRRWSNPYIFYTLWMDLRASTWFYVPFSSEKHLSIKICDYENTKSHCFASSITVVLKMMLEGFVYLSFWSYWRVIFRVSM